jgi:hypothetical protein
MEASSNASQFNLGSHRAQGASFDLVGQTKNLQPIDSIPTPIGESAESAGGTAGGCPSGSVNAAGNGGCGGGGMPAAKPRREFQNGEKIRFGNEVDSDSTIPPRTKPKADYDWNDTFHGAPPRKSK